jgi:hypothetical protein
MINYISAGEWSSNLWVIVGLVVIAVIAAKTILDWFFD